MGIVKNSRFFMILFYLSLSPIAKGGTFSGWFESFVSGVDCGKINEQEFNQLKNECIACSQNVPEVIETKQSNDYSSIAERLFFDKETKEHIARLSCQDLQSKEVVKNKELLNSIATDIANKIPSLKEMFQRLKEARLASIAQGNKLRDTNQVCNVTHGEERKKCVEQHNLDAELLTQKEKAVHEYESEIAVLMASVWNGPTTSMQSFLKDLAENKKSPTPAEVLSKLPSVAPLISEELKNQKSLLENKCSKNKNGECESFNLSDSQKRAIIENSLDSGELKDALAKNDLAAQKFYCQLNGKYVKGVDHLNNTFAVGGVILGGATSLVPRLAFAMTGGRLFATGTRLSSVATGLSYAGLGSSFAFDLNIVNKECFDETDLNLAKGQNAGQCLVDSNSIIAYEQKIHAKRNCALAASATLLSSVAIATTPAFRGLMGKSADYVRIANKMPQKLAQKASDFITGRNAPDLFPSVDQMRLNAKEANELLNKYGLKTATAFRTNPELLKREIELENAVANHEIELIELLPSLNKARTNEEIIQTIEGRNKEFAKAFQTVTKDFIFVKSEITTTQQEIKQLELIVKQRQVYGQKNSAELLKDQALLAKKKQDLVELKEMETRLDGDRKFLTESIDTNKEVIAEIKKELNDKGLDKNKLEQIYSEIQQKVDEARLKLDSIRKLKPKNQLTQESVIAERASTDVEREAVANGRTDGLLTTHVLIKAPKPAALQTSGTPFMLTKEFNNKFDVIQNMGGRIVLDPQLQRGGQIIMRDGKVEIVMGPKAPADYFDMVYSQFLFQSKAVSTLSKSSEAFVDHTQKYHELTKSLPGILSKKLDLAYKDAGDKLKVMGWRSQPLELYKTKWEEQEVKIKDLISKMIDGAMTPQLKRDLDKQIKELAFNHMAFLQNSVEEKLIKAKLDAVEGSFFRRDANATASLLSFVQSMSPPKDEKDMAHLYTNEKGDLMKFFINPQSGKVVIEVMEQKK